VTRREPGAADRREAPWISEQARKGSITAAVHLERALRLGDVVDDDDEDDIWAELDEFRPTRQSRR
jgi:hypothetical protein